MLLQPTKTTLTGIAPVFKDIRGVFSGGFSLVTTGFNLNVELPAGSMLKVDEEARTATPIKTGKLLETNSATGLVLSPGTHFQAGDYVAKTVGGKAYEVSSVTKNTDNDYLVIASAIDSGATGSAVFESSATGATAAAIKTLPNAISQFSVNMLSGGEISAVYNADVYDKTMQPHVDGHLANMDHIFFTKSY